MSIIVRNTETFECILIAPTQSNNKTYQKTHNDAIAALEEQLASTFWGFTCNQSRGAWLVPNRTLETEFVNVYRIAIKPGQWNELVAIASAFKINARQECIYLKHWDNTIHSIESDTWQTNNAQQTKHVPFPKQVQTSEEYNEQIKQDYLNKTKPLNHDQACERRHKANAPAYTKTG